MVMKKIWKTLGVSSLALIGITAIGYILLRPRQLKTPGSLKNLSELEDFLNELAGYNADSPSGLSLVVVKDGEIVYQKGFGLADGPQNRAATPETVYNYWSMTKPFTAVAILQLYEKGLLDLDASATNCLPFFEVKYPNEDSQVITIRHLLNHSSGLRNNIPEVVGWVHTDGGKDWNQTELLQEKFPDYAQLSYEPGTESRYTNVGYMVLAAVIESVSGQTYEEYVRENILKPLGMDRTDFVYTEPMLTDEATAAHPRLDYQTLLLPFLLNDMDELIRERQDGVIWFKHIYSDQNGPTGLIGPATDTAHFMMAYLNGGELDGVRILSDKTTEMMTYDGHMPVGGTPKPFSKNVYHGFAWLFVRQGERFYLGHNGGGPGFATGMRLYPDDNLGIAIMANGTYLDTDGILDLVANVGW